MDANNCTNCIHAKVSYYEKPCLGCLGFDRWVSATEDGADQPHDRPKIASDGLSTDYYKLPAHAQELRHLISHKGMSFARGNVFKACYRLGEKAGVDALYDINKIIFFAEEMKEMIEWGEVV